MIDLSPALNLLPASVTRTRRKAGYYTDDGVFREGAIDSRTAISASVQVIRGSELKDLPEGIRTEAQAVAWSTASLENDDIVTFRGNDYRVLATNYRYEGAFTRAILGRVAS